MLAAGEPIHGEDEVGFLFQAHSKADIVAVEDRSSPPRDLILFALIGEHQVCGGRGRTVARNKGDFD